MKVVFALGVFGHMNEDWRQSNKKAICRHQPHLQVTTGTLFTCATFAIHSLIDKRSIYLHLFKSLKFENFWIIQANHRPKSVVALTFQALH